MRMTSRAGSAMLLLMLSACGINDPKAARGFRLPDGNAQAGRAAFIALRCYSCHEVAGIDEKFPGTAAASIRLGGQVTRVRSYGELVTSIINPSHKISPEYDPAIVAPNGRSLMEFAALNDKMTVRQLIDLVAFLQSTYHVMPPDVNPYIYLYP